MSLYFLFVSMQIVLHVDLAVFLFTGRYGVATISRLDKIIVLFCRIASLLWGSFAKETYNLIDPTNISHPIYTYVLDCVFWLTCSRVRVLFSRSRTCEYMSRYFFSFLFPALCATPSVNIYIYF